ncbi:dicarboxylic amino acid permease [Kluyveromyces marxianus]|nr:dicarboxylic amino acid permease [Kluyveromyces marxianus]
MLFVILLASAYLRQGSCLCTGPSLIYMTTLKVMTLAKDLRFLSSECLLSSGIPLVSGILYHLFNAGVWPVIRIPVTLYSCHHVFLSHCITSSQPTPTMDLEKNTYLEKNMDLEKNTYLVETSSNLDQSHSHSPTDTHELSPGFDGKHDGIRLKKALKARHVSMIAIGGSLGTGLLIGTGSSLSLAGPGSILIAYAFVGLLVYIVMSCLGEMAAYIPLDGFTSYATRYADPALGFAVGYSYLFKYWIIVPNQLTAGALVIQYWIDRDKVNPGVWITVFLAAIVLINFLGVRFFGEIEFYISAIKILVMLGLILLLLILACGGGPHGDARGFKNWSNPGAFKEYSKAITGDKGRFVAFVSVFVLALFAYLGTELCGIVVSECKNPRKAVPKAIKLTMYRIIIFYLISIFLLGLVVPYDDKLLLNAKKAKTSAAASPFVVAIIKAGIPVLPSFMNACVLIFVFSAANSDLYVASRSLYGLAIDNKAPKIFAKTNKNGVPYWSMLMGILFALLAYMNVSSGSAQVFNYFVNCVSIFGLMSWISILIIYIRFDRAFRVQGVSKDALTYKSPFQPYSAWFALFFCCLIGLIKNFTAFLGDKFDYKSFITGYIGIPVYIISYVGYKLWNKTKLIPSEEVDLVSFKEPVDLEEEEGKLLDEERAAYIKAHGKDMKWYYEKIFGWIV